MSYIEVKPRISAVAFEIQNYLGLRMHLEETYMFFPSLDLSTFFFAATHSFISSGDLFIPRRLVNKYFGVSEKDVGTAAS